MIIIDCIFCKIITGDIPSNKIYEDENFLGFLDINPAGTLNGHSMLITKKHFPNKLEEMDDKLIKDFFVVLKKIISAIKKVSGTDSINIIQNSGEKAGQIIDHIHFHIIPREEGDGIIISENRQHKKDNLKEVAEKIRNSVEN